MEGGVGAGARRPGGAVSRNLRRRRPKIDSSVHRLLLSSTLCHGFRAGKDAGASVIGKSGRLLEENLVLLLHLEDRPNDFLAIEGVVLDGEDRSLVFPLHGSELLHGLPQVELDLGRGAVPREAGRQEPEAEREPAGGEEREPVELVPEDGAFRGGVAGSRLLSRGHRVPSSRALPRCGGSGSAWRGGPNGTEPRS